jgi:SNF2 family DNA or RNA helicase
MKLIDYQDRGVSFLYERDRGIILGSMGAGKTAIALTTMQEMLQDNIVKRWVVFAPKRVARDVWPDEKNIWAPKLRLASGTGSAQKRDTAIASNANIVVLNYDLITTLKPEALSSFDGVIFDELTRLKNPSGKRFKALIKLISHIKIRYGLTGSFTSNGLEDVFGQCKILDESVLGKSKTPFLQSYFVCINREFGEWVPLSRSFERVMQRIKPITFLVENKEYRDQLPPLHIVPVKVKMTNRKPYDELKKEMVTSIRGEQITALSAASLTTKLQQCSSGFAYQTETIAGKTKLETVRTPHWFSRHKFDRLDEIIEENQRAPTLVFYQYVEELEELRRRYPQLQTLDDKDAIQRFNEGKIEMLAAHPKSAAHGLNLQHGSHHIVFLSLPWSFELYEQCIARLHRKGQAHPVWVYILMTENTIDTRILQSLNDKRDVSVLAVDELRNN